MILQVFFASLRHGSQVRCRHQFYKKTLDLTKYISEDNKAGVMISMLQTMQPFLTSVFALNRIKIEKPPSTHYNIHVCIY